MTFAETGSRVPVTLGGGVATPDTSTIVVSGSDASGSVLVGSFDGGHTWSVVLRAGAAGFADLGFTTTTQGVVVTSSANGLDRLLITRDGGQLMSAGGGPGPRRASYQSAPRQSSRSVHAEGRSARARGGGGGRDGRGSPRPPGAAGGGVHPPSPAPSHSKGTRTTSCAAPVRPTPSWGARHPPLGRRT